MLNTSKVRTSAGVGAELNYAVRKLPPQTEKKECYVDCDDRPAGIGV